VTIDYKIVLLRFIYFLSSVAL